MRLVYHKNNKISKLAWCLVGNKNKEIFNLYHGENVEVHENCFFEGTWDGDFSEFEFEKANFFLGSGGKIEDLNKLTISTPSHILERIYVIRKNDEIYISNSMPFILVKSNLRLDKNYFGYENDLNSILKGINNYKNNIPLSGGELLEIYYYCNITLDSEFVLKIKSKKNIDQFKDYDDYINRLNFAISKISENANSKKRMVRYGFVTTISKGYDAAASAAIVKNFGCDAAISFDKPKKYCEDCGDEIAKKLGYKNIIKKDADKYLKNTDLIEAEFVSSGELGTGIVFYSFENEFKNNIVCIGERGDKIWDKNRSDVNNEFYFDNEVFTGTSLIENRLKVGYIILPIPLFSAINWESINNISNSKEMIKFSIGGNYDRPIPRRILEESGIDRSMFGMEKKGAGFNYRYDNLSRIKKRMSKKSFESFYKFYRANKRKGLIKYYIWIKFIWGSKKIYAAYLLNKFGISVNLNINMNDKTSNPGASSYLFNWGINEMIKKYEE
ncbi:hypothetical protein QTH00_13495 [Clostridium perfringens]|nr:hypothetical protein [Clostridium perfringens]MDM0503865.1 hypothetical protein [Clostridium perfringens]MDM0641732.1 hypothetical protein [Clostridium perfringens]